MTCFYVQVVGVPAGGLGVERLSEATWYFDNTVNAKHRRRDLLQFYCKVDSIKPVSSVLSVRPYV